ncbi:MAG: phosphoglycerate kinase [Candidatus Gracilibacteria bacterium]|nr:phosphoglycerate kinase [Candidatus Gracilibacteria bacterium]
MTPMKIKTLAPEQVKNKVVLVRVDFNVPIKNGVVQDSTRILEALPTIKFLLKNGAKRVHLLAHLGRPKGEAKPEFSLRPVAAKLEELLKKLVEFRPDFTAGNGEVQLHENVRFDPREKKNDPAFAQEILENTGAEVFVNDGFGVSHRAHASVVGFAKKVPCLAGKLVQKEIEALSPFRSDQKMPGLSILAGGVKMETKVAVLRHFATTAENILLGGALGTTFLAAQGFDVGESLYEPEQFETAREILEIAKKNQTAIHLPVDVECADDPDGESVYVPIEDVTGSMKIFDIGPRTIASFREVLTHSQTVIWNGPMGFFEKQPFDNGTTDLARTLTKLSDVQTILGGGDTISAIAHANVPAAAFTHISTGGGAMLEFLEGKALPGIEVLK